MLGYIENSDFINELNNIKIQATDTSNLLTVRINILRYKLLEHNSFNSLSIELEAECQNIFNLIEECNCTERIKNLFKVWNSEIESIILNDKLRLNLNTIKLKEALGSKISVNEKKEQILSFITFQSHF